MEKDVVCVESELSIAHNKIVEYGNFLSEAIESYVAILAEVQERGIQDDLVCSKLSEVAQSVTPYKTYIVETCNEIADEIRDYVDQMTQVDGFKFPDDIMSDVASAISQFL